MISCTKNFEDLNTDKKHPTEVPGNFIFANAEVALVDQIASTNVNLNVWKLFVQHWTETTYPDEANYDIYNRNIPDNNFRVYYRDILKDLYEAHKVISEEPAEGETAIAEKQNRLLIIDILKVYAWQELVDMFGDIPYTEALDIDNIEPRYDDAFSIYQDLFATLDGVTSGLNENYGSFGSTDLILGGDVAMWKKFAYSLKVKLAISIVDHDATLAQTVIEGAFANGFAPGDIVQLVYAGGANANPLFEDLVQSGRHDFVPANTLVDKMNELNDPRRPFYFTEYEGAYVGGIYGDLNAFGQFSHIADPIQEATYPQILMDYTELAFYLAEAAARGFNVGGTAEEYYNYGIGSSIVHWGGTQDDAVAYISQPDVFYTTAPGDWKQKIATQAWIAYYLRGFTAYTTYRRLDAPEFNPAPVPETDDGLVPRRFTYPTNEQTLNASNREAAAAAIGGDNMTTKLFWDKY
jgi:hypothetical protein